MKRTYAIPVRVITTRQAIVMVEADNADEARDAAADNAKALWATIRATRTHRIQITGEEFEVPYDQTREVVASAPSVDLTV